MADDIFIPFKLHGVEEFEFTKHKEGLLDSFAKVLGIPSTLVGKVWTPPAFIGYYSPFCSSLFGAEKWRTKEGKEVWVNEVTPEGRTPFLLEDWADLRCVGEVVTRLVPLPPLTRAQAEEALARVHVGFWNLSRN